MPALVFERFPAPSLRTYTCVSVGLLSFSIYYALQVTSAPDWRSSLNLTDIFEGILELPNYDGSYESKEKKVAEQEEVTVPISDDDPSVNLLNYTSTDRWKNFLTFMIQEPICIWSTINMAYCCLFLLGTFIQDLVFGELRVSEEQHVKDRFWNFLFYKFIFVFGVINVHLMDEIVVWCSWFSILGFLHLLAQLGKDRFEYLSFSPAISGWNHVRLLTLLVVIYLFSALMFLISVVIGYYMGFCLFAFMAAECVQLNLRTLHILFRYGMHLHEIRNDSAQSTASTALSWEQKAPIFYYTELVLELSVLLIDLAHHIHMLLWGNFFLSMATLVICIQIRYIFNEVQRRVRKHRNYLWVLGYMKKNYPMATNAELTENSDNCAICWERMDTARKLPCTHLFHDSCLLSWLEQDTSCPKCRTVLSMQPPLHVDDARSARRMVDHADNPQPVLQQPPQLQNHFFHFDGSRYVSWLPSFSVEVTHTTQLRAELATGRFVPGATVPGAGPTGSVEATSQMEAMARQVQQMFPQYPIAVVIDDLRITRSPELTIENILEGRVHAPAPVLFSPPTPTATNESSSNSTSHFWPPTTTITSGFDENREEETDSEFSPNATERQRSLLKRKESLISIARKRYLDKHKDSLSAASTS